MSTNPEAVVRAFDAAFNALDVDHAVALFSENGFIKAPNDPIIYSGKDQVRKWIADQVGKASVVSANHRVAGDTVVWEGRLTGELVRQMGASSLDELAEAVVRDGKIISFTLIISAFNV